MPEREEPAILPVEWPSEQMIIIIIEHREGIYNVKPQCLGILFPGQANIAAVEYTEWVI